MGIKRSPAKTHDDGSILVLVLLITFAVLGVGLTAMWASDSGTNISANLTRRQEALYAAETGIGRARMILQNWPDWSPLLNGALCSATKDDPGGKGTVLCDATLAPAPALEDIRVIPAGSTTASEAPDLERVVYTTYIRNDDAEYQWCNGVVEAGELADAGDCDRDGDSDTDDLNIRLYDDRDRRVVLRSEGIGRDGLSQVAVEVVLSAGVSALGVTGYSQKGGSGGQGANAAPSATIP